MVLLGRVATQTLTSLLGRYVTNVEYVAYFARGFLGRLGWSPNSPRDHVRARRVLQSAEFTVGRRYSAKRAICRPS